MCWLVSVWRAKLLGALWYQGALSSAQAPGYEVIDRQVSLGDRVARRLVPGFGAFSHHVEGERSGFSRHVLEQGEILQQRQIGFEISARQEPSHR